MCKVREAGKSRTQREAEMLAQSGATGVSPVHGQDARGTRRLASAWAGCPWHPAPYAPATGGERLVAGKGVGSCQTRFHQGKPGGGLGNRDGGELSKSRVSVHGSVGDWSIFRPIDAICAHRADRKMDLSPSAALSRRGQGGTWTNVSYQRAKVNPEVGPLRPWCPDRRVFLFRKNRGKLSRGPFRSGRRRA